MSLKTKKKVLNLIGVRDWVLSLTTHMKSLCSCQKNKKKKEKRCKQQPAALMTAQVVFGSHVRVKKKGSANTFLTTVDGRLLLHAASHDRHRALPVTQIKQKVELKKGSSGFISHWHIYQELIRHYKTRPVCLAGRLKSTWYEAGRAL